MAFKMKGNPMQRNFGVGASSPAQKSAYPAKGDPKRRNYSKSVIDDTVENVTKNVSPNVKDMVRRDSQRTMTQDRNKLNELDLANDEGQINLSKTKKGEKYMPKIMAPESIKSKPIPEKTLESPTKALGDNGKSKAERQMARKAKKVKKKKGNAPFDGMLAETVEEMVSRLVATKGRKPTVDPYKAAGKAAGKAAAAIVPKTAGLKKKKIKQGKENY